jgi:hypothetical protein
VSPAFALAGKGGVGGRSAVRHANACSCQRCREK